MIHANHREKLLHSMVQKLRRIIMQQGTDYQSVFVTFFCQFYLKLFQYCPTGPFNLSGNVVSTSNVGMLSNMVSELYMDSYSPPAISTERVLCFADGQCMLSKIKLLLVPKLTGISASIGFTMTPCSPAAPGETACSVRNELDYNTSV